MEICATGVMEAWRAAIKQILSKGRIFVDEQGHECHELSNLTVVVENPSTAVEGVRAMRKSRKWRYPSEEELTNIMLNKENASIYDYLYGQRIFDYGGALNQVDDYVLPLLTKHPTSRRAVITLIDPVRDMKLDAKNILGLVLIHFRIIEERLCVTAVIRTSGFFTGWPANIFQLAKLQQHIAHTLNMPAGRITSISLSAHLHTETFEDMSTVLGQEFMQKAMKRDVEY